MFFSSMEDEYFGELSLNLVSEDRSTLYGKKTKVFGDRPSRVKQRKEAKEKNDDGTQFGSSQNSEKTDKKRKREGDTTTIESASRHRNKKKKPDVYISSLFRKNPEIPHIPSAKVDTVAENIFTGQTFKDLHLHPFLASNLDEKQGFTQLTEVQKMAIPLLLRKEDALIKSQTGSGKTLAYAVPIVQSLQSRKVKIKRDDGPYALVIVPTRELALQSYETFVKLLRTFIWIVPGCLMGGEKRKAEKSRLRKGVNILVATPGRLMDHIKTTSVLSLAKIQWLVIDEADRLLELGYERDVAQIINSVKSQCLEPPQTVLLSATLSEGVERLSSITLNNPQHINVTEAVNQTQRAASSKHTDSASRVSAPLITTTGQSFSVPSQLKQHFIVTPCKLRLVTLAALVLWKCKYSKPASKIIVFFSTQDSVEFHKRLFSKILLPQPRNVKKRLSKLAVDAEDVGDSDEDVGDSDEDVGDSDEDVGDSDEDGYDGSDGGKSGLRLFHLHGEMPQKDRSRTFQEFSEAASGVLLCTDVAARGIDLPYVDWIVQYTSPGATVDYIHRVGRTARAGTEGQSLLFLMPSEVGYLQELNKHKISLSQMEMTTILKHLLANITDLPPAESADADRQMPRTAEEAATYLQDRAEECLLRDKDMHNLAGRGFQSFIRAYATYSREVKDIFKVSDLHLGHVAKSFALREAPTKVHGVAAKFGFGQKKNRRVDKPSKRPLSFRQATLSEYSSGIQSGSKKVWAKPGGKMKRKKN